MKIQKGLGGLRGMQVITPHLDRLMGCVCVCVVGPDKLIPMALIPRFSARQMGYYGSTLKSSEQLQ